MNNSFRFGGMPEQVVTYEGMPAAAGASPPA
jgi:hypothetical protein